jgi:LmbE family N-acetylglucosaminyl deacetylase
VPSRDGGLRLGAVEFIVPTDLWQEADPPSVLGHELHVLEPVPGVEVTWVVMSACGQRATEARRSANALLKEASRTKIVLHRLPDGHFPAHFAEAKKAFEALKAAENPDVILSHRLEDRHQDHRLVAELTWQTWRSHLILEYEVPKYDGDMSAPNTFVPLEERIRERKIDHLMSHFESQLSKRWFQEDLFSSLLRLRGMECNSPTSYAEAFFCRKAVLT